MKPFSPTSESKSLMQPSTNDAGNKSSSVHREPHMGLHITACTTAVF